MMKDESNIKKLIVLFQPYTKSIIILMLYLIISTILNLFLPLIKKQIMDEGFLKNDFKVIIICTLISFGLVGLDNMLNVFKEIRRADVCAKITYSLQEKAYKHITKLNIEYFNKTNYTEILNNISVDVENMSRIADNSVFFVITQVFSMLGGIIGLLIIDWRLTIIVFCFIPMKYLVVKYFAKRRKKLQVEYMQNSSYFAQWFGDTIAGVKEIRLFDILENKLKEFRDKQTNVVNTQKNISILDSKNVAVESMIIQLLLMFINIVGANLIFNLQLTIGSIFAFITYSSYVTTPISAILNIGYMLSGIIPSTKRFYEFLDLKEESYEIPKKHNEQLEKINGNISFKDIYFSYVNEQPVLQNISFEILSGEKVALIGVNGSGKSTIIDLLLRFYKPNSGTITLDGKNIEKFNIEEYRSYISVVSQQIYLFDESIKHNISLYSDISNEVIDKAIEDSQLSEFGASISLDDFNLGQNGSKLSGGQKQKIAMARALVRDKPILIFDEATSNLDVESEMNITKLLNTRLKHKTVIMVTHKLEILKHVDKIILIDEGYIKQIGTHCELLENSDLYKNMISLFEK